MRRTLVQHSCRTLLRDKISLQKSTVTSPERALRARFLPKVTRQVYRASVSCEIHSKSYTSSVQDKRFGRDFFKNSRVKSPKRAFRTRRPVQKSRVKSPKRAFRARHHPKVTCQSLQNAHFARDFLKNPHLKSAKQAFRTRLPPKVTRQVFKTSVSNETSTKVARQVSKTSISYETILQKPSGKLHRSTHIKQPCQALSRFQPLQTTPAHTPIPMSQ